MVGFDDDIEWDEPDFEYQDLSPRQVFKIKLVVFEYFCFEPGQRGSGRMTMAELLADIHLYTHERISEETLRRFVMGYLWDPEDKNTRLSTLRAVTDFCIHAPQIRKTSKTIYAGHDSEVDPTHFVQFFSRDVDVVPTVFPSNLFGHYIHVQRNDTGRKDLLLSFEPLAASANDPDQFFATAKLQAIDITDNSSGSDITKIETSLGWAFLTAEDTLLVLLKNIRIGENLLLYTPIHTCNWHAVENVSLVFCYHDEPLEREIEEGGALFDLNNEYTYKDKLDEIVRENRVTISKKYQIYQSIDEKDLKLLTETYRKLIRKIKKENPPEMRRGGFGYASAASETDVQKLLAQSAAKEGVSFIERYKDETMPTEKVTDSEELKALTRSAFRAASRCDIGRLQECFNAGVPVNAELPVGTGQRLIHQVVDALPDYDNGGVPTRDAVRFMAKNGCKFHVRDRFNTLPSTAYRHGGGLDRTLLRYIRMLEKREGRQADPPVYPRWDKDVPLNQYVPRPGDD